MDDDRSPLNTAKTPSDSSLPVFGGRVPALNVPRGIAAISISVFHFFALYSSTQNVMGSGLNRVVGNFFGQGASLFYALSGVSLYIVFFDRLNEPGFTAGFYRRRFFPIAQLFYCALLVWSTIFISNGGSIEWLKFFTSATLLFNFVPGWYDSYEAAGWTVGVEVIFYVGLLFLLTLVRSARVAVVLWIFSVIFSTSGETIDVSLRQFGSLVGGTYPMFSE